jgi:hypothetical protein
MSDLNKDRCPKCFTKYSENKWTEDPILTNNGSKFIYDNVSGLLIPQSDITKRLYKGFYQIKSQIIKELQENRQQAENDAGILPANQTVFSKTEDDANGYWVINMKHIKELRESTEKILTAIGQTKEEYFNYDEEQVERQTPHQMDWIDPILDNWKGNLKDRHIEDLRKAILQQFAEYFNITIPEIYYDETKNDNYSVTGYTNGSFNADEFFSQVVTPIDTLIRGGVCTISGLSTNRGSSSSFSSDAYASGSGISHMSIGSNHDVNLLVETSGTGGCYRSGGAGIAVGNNCIAIAEVSYLAPEILLQDNLTLYISISANTVGNAEGTSTVLSASITLTLYFNINGTPIIINLSSGTTGASYTGIYSVNLKTLYISNFGIPPSGEFFEKFKISAVQSACGTGTVYYIVGSAHSEASSIVNLMADNFICRKI